MNICAYSGTGRNTYYNIYQIIDSNSFQYIWLYSNFLFDSMNVTSILRARVLIRTTVSM